MSEIAEKRTASSNLNYRLLKTAGALASVVVALFAFYVLPMSGWSHSLIFVAGISFCYSWLVPTEGKN